MLFFHFNSINFIFFLISFFVSESIPVSFFSSMSIVRKFILKFNQRQGEPATTMRLRSGTQYNLINQEQEEDNDVVFENGAQMPTPIIDNTTSTINNMSMMRLHPIELPMQDPIPVALPMPMPMSNPPRQRRITRLQSVVNGLVRVVQSLPGILTTIAGIHTIMEIIYPPDQHIEVVISQQPWWQWWQ